MAYSEKVVDHYENPRNVGSFGKDDDNIGTGMVGAPACGDVMKLQIKVKDGIITDAKFKTYGCGSAIASSSLVTEWVKGRTLDQAAALKNSEIAEELILAPHGMVLDFSEILTATSMNWKHYAHFNKVSWSLTCQASSLKLLHLKSILPTIFVFSVAQICRNPGQ